MNDLLPPYFNYMKPNLPVICNHYNVRNPKFHLPAIKHDFAKQLIQHYLIKLLNKDENISEIANKIFDQTFCMFKSTLKNKVITSYNDKCINPNNCVSCKRLALDVHGLVGVDVVDGVDGVEWGGWGGCSRWSVISNKYIFSVTSCRNYVIVAFMLVSIWVRFLEHCERNETQHMYYKIIYIILKKRILFGLLYFYFYFAYVFFLHNV